MGPRDSFRFFRSAARAARDPALTTGLRTCRLPSLLRLDPPEMVCAGNLRLMYIELHARSAFSFLEGASVPEELAGVCADYGMPAMALLDRDGVYGSPRFYMAAQKKSIRAHIGAEVTSEHGWRYPLL